MDVKIMGTVKVRGKWLQTDDVAKDLSDEHAQELVDKGAGVIVEGSATDKLKELRERAAELGVANAAKLGEKKLLEGIAEKEAELQAVADAQAEQAAKEDEGAGKEDTKE
jgi:hypothetical protein